MVLSQFAFCNDAILLNVMVQNGSNEITLSIKMYLPYSHITELKSE